ncbi:MAG: NAD-dependent epimerase/dehydratase family protein [Prolixibacteraceae bacterium]|nr:NAD-dependent epimerase/dehydratase family protein [Prolixibacteraceae bacterium]
MKVLVTGANGLLASNLVRELLYSGYEVRGMVRENSNLLALKHVDVELLKGEITNTADIRKAFAGCEAVVHAAANTSQWPTNYEAYKKTNVDVTQLLLDEAVRRGIEKFIFVSSANAFDSGTKANPGTEESPFSMKGKSGYMLSKQVAQELVLGEFRRSGLPTVVVNPTFMLGKYDAKPSSGQIILMAQQKKMMIYPPGGKNFVHVADVARGIANAISLGIPGECYLLAGENLSYREFFEKLRLVHGHPQRLARIPRAAIRLAGNLGSLYENLSGKPAKLNSVNAQLLCTDNYYSSQKAVQNLNLAQTPVSQAIEDAMEWFSQYGYL